MLLLPHRWAGLAQHVSIQAGWRGLNVGPRTSKLENPKCHFAGEDTETK